MVRELSLDISALLASSRVCTLDLETAHVTFDDVQNAESLHNFPRPPSDSRHLALLVKHAHPIKEHQLVIGGYQGGYTVWESTWVFLKFILSHLPNDPCLILELGCGHGAVGLFAVSKGHRVIFQDLNHDVFQEVLIPNLLLQRLQMSDFSKSIGTARLKLSAHHTSSSSEGIKCESLTSIAFDVKMSTSNECNNDGGNASEIDANVLDGQILMAACDWEALVSDANSLFSHAVAKCEMILGCEIVYKTEHYKTLAQVLSTYLSPSGVAFIASKRVYFGLGGSSFGFVEHLRNFGHGDSSVHFSAEICFSMASPNSCNIIDIIAIKKV